MLKRLSGVSSKLAQNKLFLPGFPATSLLFLFCLFPTTADRNSQPLTPPKPAPFLPSFAWPKDKPENSSSSSPLSQPAGLSFSLQQPATGDSPSSQTGAALFLSSHPLHSSPTQGHFPSASLPLQPFPAFSSSLKPAPFSCSFSPKHNKPSQSVIRRTPAVKEDKPAP